MKNWFKQLLSKSNLIKSNKPFFTKDIFKSYSNFNIGDFTYGEPRVLFPNEANLVIGKYCSIAQNVTIFLGGNHRTDWISTYPFPSINEFKQVADNIEGHPISKGDVTIGNDVWIGRDVIILSGVTISDGAVIGAGSIVSKNIGPYEIWGGNPAKHIKNRFSEDITKKLLEIEWWDWPDTKVRSYIPHLCNTNVENFIHSCSKN